MDDEIRAFVAGVSVSAIFITAMFWFFFVFIPQPDPYDPPPVTKYTCIDDYVTGEKFFGCGYEVTPNGY